MNITVTDALELAEKTLSAKRFAHTAGVQKMSAIVGRYCLPDETEELCVAAALHDITKELTLEEQIRRIDANGDKITADDLACPEILHSYTGAYFVRDYLKGEGAECIEKIATSIINHTTGAVDMSVFDEIIFISDFIEEGRTYENSIKTRELLLGGFRELEYEKNVNLLHRACAEAMGHTIEHLTELGRHVHPRTVAARASLISKIRDL